MGWKDPNLPPPPGYALLTVVVASAGRLVWCDYLVCRRWVLLAAGHGWVKVVVLHLFLPSMYRFNDNLFIPSGVSIFRQDRKTSDSSDLLLVFLLASLLILKSDF